MHLQTFQDRLIHAMKINDIKQVHLVDGLQVSKGTISNWVAGKHEPKGGDLLFRLAKILRVDANWLQNGTGGMTDVTTMAGYAQVSEWGDDTPLEEDEVDIPLYKDLSFACGRGAVNDDALYKGCKLRMGRRTLRSQGVQPENTFAAVAKDDSMMPHIQDGDTIYIDQGRRQIKDGKVFAIRIDELYLCKRLYRTTDGGVRIVSDNAEEYPEIIISKQDISQGRFEIIGWIWSVSRLERW